MTKIALDHSHAETRRGFQIGFYKKCASGKAERADLEIFDVYEDFRGAAQRVVTLAFDHAETRYVVKAPDGQFVLQFEVTKRGAASIDAAASFLLSNHKEAFRATWANSNYTLNSNIMLCGDTQAITSALGKVIAPGKYKFDHDPKAATSEAMRVLSISSN